MGYDDDGTGDASSEAVRLSHDWTSDESVSARILQGVAAVTDTPPTDLDPPLYEVINPEALDDLWEPLSGDALRDGSGHLTLSLYGCTVRLYHDGTIEIDAPDDS